MQPSRLQSMVNGSSHTRIKSAVAARFLKNAKRLCGIELTRGAKKVFVEFVNAV
jgi:hypothetical protein